MDKDMQAISDLQTLIEEARQSIQDAYSISCIIDHLRCHKVPEYEQNTCYTYINDMASDIIARLDKYGFDFKPNNPLKGGINQ